MFPEPRRKWDSNKLVSWLVIIWPGLRSWNQTRAFLHEKSHNSELINNHFTSQQLHRIQWLCWSLNIENVSINHLILKKISRLEFSFSQFSVSINFQSWSQWICEKPKWFLKQLLNTAKNTTFICSQWRAHDCRLDAHKIPTACH